VSCFPGDQIAGSKSSYTVQAHSQRAVTETLNTASVYTAQPQERARGLRRTQGLTALGSLQQHWPEYVMEVGELGLYMFLTCAFATLVLHPGSPLRHAIPSNIARRALMGVGMGLAVVAIILSPWGKQSGGHFNPAITVTFYRLGKVEFWDLWFYVIAQFIGAVAGVAIARYAFGAALGNGTVRYAVTAPGMYGRVVAFLAELAISFLLMIAVLFLTNRPRLAPYTAYFVALLVAVYITFETPLSGMSTNPARTFGSALHADYWRALWIYFLAPSLGMLFAAEAFLRIRGGSPPFCAKLHHANSKRCIFHHPQATEIENEQIARKGHVV
jgi:aquaporin Z